MPGTETLPGAQGLRVQLSKVWSSARLFWLCKNYLILKKFVYPYLNIEKISNLYNRYVCT